MHLLYCDETNLEERAGDFFVYGGVSVPAEAARELSAAIDEIRARAGVARDFRVKFNPGPKDLDHKTFIALKQQIVEAAAAHGAKLFVSMILHDIATSPDDARRNEINRICYHFDCYLHRHDSPGLVLIDRFSDAQIDAHLAEKFSTGLKGLPYSNELRLKNIVGFHYSAIGQSHFTSLIDILLGSYRFVVNAYTRTDERALQTARVLLPILSPLFYREGESKAASEISLFFSPKVVKVKKYRDRYQGLKEFLSSMGIDTEQTV